MENYEVNEDTAAVMGVNKNATRVIETENEYFINDSAYEVMDYSCRYFGSSYTGRVDGSKKILGANYKVPVIVEESSDLIFFSIASPEDKHCVWLSLKWIKDVYEKNGTTYVEFKNGKRIICKCSVASIKNQIMRASRLNTLLNERKKVKNS